MYADIENIPAEFIRLLFIGAQLEDGKTLA
jgi:hypothetical protein